VIGIVHAGCITGSKQDLPMRSGSLCGKEARLFLRLWNPKCTVSLSSSTPALTAAGAEMICDQNVEQTNAAL